MPKIVHGNDDYLNNQVTQWWSQRASINQMRDYLDQLFTKQIMNNTSAGALTPTDKVDKQRRLSQAVDPYLHYYPTATAPHPTPYPQLTLNDLRPAILDQRPKYGRVGKVAP